MVHCVYFYNKIAARVDRNICSKCNECVQDIPCLVLVLPRKNGPNMTEKLLTGMKRIKTNKIIFETKTIGKIRINTKVPHKICSRRYLRILLFL